MGKLADLNFKIRYRPGKLNADANNLSRLPLDFHTYMDSCTEKLIPESLHASISACSPDIVKWGLNLADSPD